MSHSLHLTRLRSALQDIQSGAIHASDFVRQARDLDALLVALPPAFSTVWSDLLNRLESGAMFNEDSCSFSQSQVLDSMALWLDKAEARLGMQGN